MKNFAKYISFSTQFPLKRFKNTIKSDKIIKYLILKDFFLHATCYFAKYVLSAPISLLAIKSAIKS